MKAFVSALILATAVALNSEFIQGAETGLFMTSEAQFEDYKCEMPVIDKQIKGWIDMLTPMKTMMEAMNQGQPNKMMNMLDEITKELGIIYTLGPWGEYEGGDFCRGLILSKEMMTVFWHVAGDMMHTFFDHQTDVPEVAEWKYDSANGKKLNK